MRIFNEFQYGLLDGIGRPLADKLYKQRPSWTAASISDKDAAFFAGLAMTVRPCKVVEVGVASGWGSVVFLEALASSRCESTHYFGVDIAERFFYDQKYATGDAVSEVASHRAHHYKLLIGRTMAEVAEEIGDGIDFAFIDAHHMHPWPTLDLLSLLPYLKPGSWIALHDLNLCRKQDQEHQNRGPKYLFEAWEEDKAHSIEIPTMAGAIRIGKKPEEHLPLLLDILHTPWELTVEERFLSPLIAAVSRSYGSTWGNEFQRAVDVGNYLKNATHGRSYDLLYDKIARLRSSVSKNARDLLTRIVER
jgi:predicted O-methyltransferase YrrM